MDCAYVFTEGTASGFTCSPLVAEIASASSLSLNHVVFVLWVALGVIAFLGAFQVGTWFFSR
jgi:uncharacterized membrane protein